MLLDNDSYYLRCHINSKGEESAYLCHYKDVWENGFVSDSYCISNVCMSFEDASWNGLDFKKMKFGTRILQCYYDRWVKAFNDCRFNIERLALSSAKPYDNDCKEGDYIYVDYKGINVDNDRKEAEEYPNEYIPDENKYDGPDLLLFHILNKSSNNCEVSEIIVDEYFIRIKEKSSADLSDYNEYTNRLFYVPKETYEKSLDTIHRTYQGLMNEMKKRVVIIEIKR